MPQVDDGKAALSLRDRVLERVRADIISGRSAPGAMYSVPSLAAELGVSTTPVREALLELSARGLITPMRNRGFKVQGSTLDDLEHLFEMRELLERFAAVKLAEAGVEETAELTRLAELVEQAVKDRDVRAYLEADRAFHEAFVAEAGNPRLTRTIMDLRDDMRLFGIDSAEGEERQRASISEHYALIELAAKRDPDAIATLITHHILSWRPLFRRALAAHTERRPL